MQLIRALLRAQYTARGARPSVKPLKRLVPRGTIPPEFDEHGQRIWWVRRHLIGPYGPTLAARPTPPPQNTQQSREAWEQALEEE